MSERYLEYQNKMKKVGDFVAKLWRYRILVLCIVVACLAFVIVMSSVAGIVSDATECPAEVVYGEELGYRAKAVFQGVRYEYRAEDEEEWTEEFPKRIGFYRVRAVSTGAGRTGEEHAFAVVPLAVSVGVAPEWVYGEDPTPVADLVYGDVLACGEYTYRFGESVSIAPEAESVSVFRGEEDVTDCYRFTVRETVVKLTPRPITVQVKDAEKVYDGKPFSSAEYEIVEGSLAYGDRLEMTCTQTLTEAGTAENLPECRITGEGDVTSRYNITLKAGALTVLKRPLKIAVGDLQKEYDGAPLSFDGVSYGLVGEVAEGEVLSVSSANRLINAGKVQIVLNVSVARGGADSTHNYEIAVEAGSYLVTPRPVAVSTGSERFVYDGERHDCRQFTARYAGAAEGARAEAEGDVFRVSEAPFVQDCSDGKRENALRLAAENANGEDVTGNYFFTYERLGEIGLLPRPVAIVTDSLEAEYNGEYQYAAGYTLSPDSEYGLLEGHTLVTRNVGVKDVRYGQDGSVAEVANEMLSYEAKDGEGRDVTQNYAVSCAELGTIKIFPRAVVAQTNDVAWEYDGERHAEVEFADVEGRLVEGHRFYLLYFVIGGKSDRVDVNVWSNAAVAGVLDEEDDDVTNNYVIEYRYGKATVAPRSILVETESGSFEYDGARHDEFHGLSDVNGRLVAGHTLVFLQSVFASPYDRLNAATWPNDVRAGVQNERGEDVTKNYAIEYRYGNVTVSPRPVTVETESGSFEYDGTRHEFQALTDLEGRLVAGHTLRYVGGNYSSEYDRIDARSWPNNVVAGIYDGGGEDVTSNYRVEYSPGTVEITRRKLVLQTQGGRFVYNGEVQCPKGFIDVYGRLVRGHKLVWHSGPDCRDVGLWYNSSHADIFDEKDRDVLTNYDVYHFFGEVIIDPRPIKIQMASAKFEYDGAPHSCPEYELAPDSEYGLVEGHALIVEQSTARTEVGSEANEGFRFTIVREDYGREISIENYQITQVFGALTVVPRKLVLQTGGAEFCYDGERHAPSADFADAEGLLLAGHAVYGAEPVYVSEYDRIDAGEWDNVYKARIKDGDGKDVTSDYEILYRYGKVVITPRPLAVGTESGTSAVYNGERREFKELSALNGGLLGGHTLYYVGSVYDGESDRLFAGQWQNRVVAGVRDGGGREISHNYALAYEYGEVTISRRPIAVRVPSTEFVYDGRPHLFETYQIEVTSGSLANGDVFGIDGSARRTDVGDYEVRGGFLILHGDSVVLDSYEIAEDVGMVRILPRPVAIVTGSADFVYDGEGHSCTDFSYAGSGYPLAEGHELRVGRPTVVTDFCKNVDNGFEDLHVFCGGEDVTRNYRIEIAEKGALSVHYRVVVTLYEIAEEYNGKPHAYEEEDAYVSENMGGLDVRFRIRGSLTEVGSLSLEEIAALSEVTASKGGRTFDREECEVVFEGAPLTVFARRIEITSESISRADDGKPLTSPNWNVTFGSLAEGHYAQAEIVGEQVGEGSSPNTIAEVKIYDASGRDVSANYDIVLRDGTLELT